MKKAILLLWLTLSAAAFAQQDAWVYFTDKPNADTYLANPLTMLSQRSLDRRTEQNIPLDLKDVPVSQDYINTLASQSGVTVYAKSKWLNAVHVRGEIADIQALTQLPFVASVDFADNAIDNGNSPAPNRPAAFQQKFETLADFPYGTSQSQINMLNGQQLHQQDYTGNGKVIAVLDAGFPGVDVLDAFARLRANGHILGGYDFVARSANFYTSNGHGTAVLSTMGGYIEDQLVGTAPDADYYLFITESNTDENPLEESLWVEAAEEADRLGVDIITTSLGYFHFVNPNYNYNYDDMNGTTAFITRGADIAFSRGIIVVASAGNSGASATDPHIGVPADGINVLAVGAVDADEVRAAFSSLGPSYDGRVKPDVSAQGQQTIIADSNGAIIAANGTSFSGPIIAGMTACLWQVFPDKTNAQIVGLIRQYADRFSSPDTFYGYGIPDFGAAMNSQLGIGNTSKEMFTVYPNPAGGQLYIRNNGTAMPSDLILYNAMGQQVVTLHFETDTTPVNLQQLPKGVYFYSITAGNNVTSGKILKQ
ncbi:S8 family serine peptidase [Flavobacterium sp.]|uniref:S8 family serine peptidase n=1 Tax=Flavobacterium sp. TaxID=239 RepID=UPI002638DF8F|nr:S8 family serine peptidase [Flavobacterium sp.]